MRTRDNKIVALLTKYKADPNIMNNKYETAITIAADNKDEDIIELLTPEIQEMIRLGTYELDKNLKSILAVRGKGGNNNDDIVSIEDIEKITGAMIKQEEENDGKFKKLLSSIDDYRTFKDKLDENEEFKLHAMQLSRKNPFGKLKRANTRKILNEIQEISDTKENLPDLEAWLQKKSQSMPYQWQRRWVVVKDSYILWSDVQRNIKNAKNAKERMRFNNSINLMCIKDIKPVINEKAGRQFIMIANLSGREKKKKEYLFKCSSREDRDYWVKGIKKHILHMKSVISFVGTK